MSTLNAWDIVDANNNATPPDGWPEATMNYSEVNNTGRAVQGTLKRFFSDVNGSLVAGGSVNAYTVTLNESGYAAYFAGMYFACKINTANTGATTLNVNAIGVQTVTDRNGAALTSGEIKAGGIYEFRYDGTNFQLMGTVVGAQQIDNILISGNTISSTGGTDLFITPLAGQQLILDGTIVIDAGVMTGATSITSTTFNGNLVGTINTAAQPNITSLGTLNILTVDNIRINGNTISSIAGTDLLITPLAGQQLVLDGTIVIDAGVVTGATSITSTTFIGALTGIASGNALTAHSHTGAEISALDTSDTTTGIFVDARIPNLAASKITSGTFVDARIPNLNASKITAGTFAAARIATHTGHVTGQTSLSLVVAGITGQTDIGAAIVDTDEFVMSDGGNIRRSDMSRLRTYAGINSVVTKHTRAGNTQIENGDNSFALFDVHTNLVSSTYETIGPTGSGATNIWTALDNLPVNAALVFITVHATAEPTGTGIGQLNFYATHGDVTTPLINASTRLAKAAFDRDASGGQILTTTPLWIPVNSNGVFKLAFQELGSTAGSCLIYYKGFMTD